jgi:hypothetical protein
VPANEVGGVDDEGGREQERGSRSKKKEGKKRWGIVESLGGLL